jgi:hypothetical protein
VDGHRLGHGPAQGAQLGFVAVLQSEPGTNNTAFVARFSDEVRDEALALRLGQRVTVSCRIDHMSTKYLEVAISLDSCRVAGAAKLSPKEAATMPEPPGAATAP